jgi:hypothetical protein
MDSLPERPGYIKRLVRNITKRLKDRGYFPAADERDSTAGTTDENLSPALSRYQELTLSSQRQDIYRDMDEIDDTMPEGSRALDVLADNAVNAEGGGLYSFIITVEGSKSYQRLLDDMVTRTRLREKIYAIARDAAKYGDNFQQIVISDRMRIERLMYMPADSMRRFEDSRGLLRPGNKEDDCAFGQYEPGTGTFIAGFYPWQIEHLRWNRSGSTKYGRAQLLSARYAWKKLQAMQEALVINWLTRAFVRLLFELDVTGKKPQESQQYLREFMRQLERRTVASGAGDDKPLSVAKDIALGNSYINLNGKWQPALNKVSVLDTSNSGFWNITAIEYWRNKFISATGVPKAHLGLEQDISARATLQWQDERFCRTVRRIQSMLSEFLSHLVSLELVLQGIDPQKVQYKIEWAPPSTMDQLEKAQALQAIATAAGPLLQLGVVDQDWLRINALRMTPTQSQALAHLKVQPPVEKPAPPADKSDE